MKKVWRGFACILLVSLFIIIAACSDEEDGNNVDIGIVLPTESDQRWVQDEQLFKDAIADSDYTAEILFSQGSSAKEKENVETLIGMGVDVLIIAAHDSAGAGAAVEAAKAEGITVIAYDRLITNTDAIDYYVTFDYAAVGEAQAEYLFDHVEGPNAPLYLFAGATSDPHSFLLFEGAWNYLQPKIKNKTYKFVNSAEAVALQHKPKLTRQEQAKIINEITTNWEPDVAKNKALANLAVVDPVSKRNVAILAPNDETARAVADVFAADSTVTDYVVTGQGAEKATVQYIIDGKQSMTILKDVRMLVTDTMSLAVTILDGDTPVTNATYHNGSINVKAMQTEVTVVNQENLKETLIDSGYYKGGEFVGLD